jgi:predicted transcriptional regulator of viral defense system
MPRIDYDRINKLFEVASQQEGYFTAKQAFQCGYSYRLQFHHKQQGTWREVDRGIFRLTNYPDSTKEDLVRWSLWSFNRAGFPQAVLSHETALSLHEMSDVMPAHIHLTVPPTFRKQPSGGCVIHKARLSDKVIEKRQGFNITTPLKTIIDVAIGNLSTDELEKAIRDGIKKGYFIPTSFEDAIIPLKARKKISSILSIIRGGADNARES